MVICNHPVISISGCNFSQCEYFEWFICGWWVMSVTWLLISLDELRLDLQGFWRPRSPMRLERPGAESMHGVDLIPGRFSICAASTCHNLISWICPPRAALSLSQGSESRSVDLKTCSMPPSPRQASMPCANGTRSIRCVRYPVLPDWDRLRHFCLNFQPLRPWLWSFRAPFLYGNIQCHCSR